MLFLTKRFHLWRHRLARWLLLRLVPMLDRMARTSGAIANEQHDKARLRLEVCKRCPVFENGWCARDKGGCGCYMPAKVQYDKATCPQARW